MVHSRHRSEPDRLLRTRSIDSLIRSERFLASIDLRLADIDGLKPRIKCYLTGTIRRVFTLDRCRILFRARLNDGDRRFSSVSELTYPDLAKFENGRLPTIGRCNREHSPVFYAALDIATAIREVRPPPSSVVTVSEWRIRPDVVFPRLIQMGVEQEDVPEEFVQVIGGRVNLSKARRINDFLRREFTRVVDRGREHEYKFTVAIAEIQFSGNRIGGIYYPSVVNGLRGVNIALLPAAVDELYRFVRCEEFNSAVRRGSAVDAGGGALQWTVSGAA